MVYQVLLTILQLAAIGLGAYLIMWALNFQKSSVRGVALAAAHGSDQLVCWPRGQAQAA
jgi:hypothetical protein